MSDPAFVFRASHDPEGPLAGKLAYVNQQENQLLVFDCNRDRICSRLLYGALQAGGLMGPPFAKATPEGFEFWIWSEPPPARIVKYTFGGGGGGGAGAGGEDGRWSKTALEPPLPSGAGRSKSARRALRAAYRAWLPPDHDGQDVDALGA